MITTPQPEGMETSAVLARLRHWHAAALSESAPGHGNLLFVHDPQTGRSLSDDILDAMIELERANRLADERQAQIVEWLLNFDIGGAPGLERVPYVARTAVAQGLEKMFPGTANIAAIVAWRNIELLRADEGNSVEIVCDNPDFNGQPNSKVIVTSAATDWKGREFVGDTVFEALQNAVDAIERGDWKTEPDRNETEGGDRD